MKSNVQPISSVNVKSECLAPVENVVAPKQELMKVDNENKNFEENVVEEQSSEELNNIGDHFSNIFLTLTSFKSSIATLHQHIKLLEKDMKKQFKMIKKTNNKSKMRGNRKPSGFAKPSDVSNELCQFMGRTQGTQIARTEVTQYLIQYIKENELQFKDNKKVILPDAALKKLLGVDSNTEVTYFNLQGLMNKHFVH